jgi:hypothetical protein
MQAMPRSPVQAGVGDGPEDGSPHEARRRNHSRKSPAEAGPRFSSGKEWHRLG